MVSPAPTTPSTITAAAAPEVSTGASTEEAAAAAAMAAMGLGGHGVVAAAVMARVVAAAGAAGVVGDSVLQLRYAEVVAKAMGVGGPGAEEVGLYLIWVWVGGGFAGD